MSGELPDVVDTLRSELLRRVERHPVHSWSPQLLTAMIAVIDLQFGSKASSPFECPSPGRFWSLVTRSLALQPFLGVVERL
jgi:hypothetical protein